MHCVFEVHVQQALVCTIKGDAALRHGQQSIVISQIGDQYHDTSVEKIWPPNVWRGAERVLERKELIRGAIGDDIGVYVDNLGKLSLLPEVELCKCRIEVGTVHQVEVRAVLVADSRDGYDLIEGGPELSDGVGGDTVEGEEDDELPCSTCISERMREDEGTYNERRQRLVRVC